MFAFVVTLAQRLLYTQSSLEFLRVSKCRTFTHMNLRQDMERLTSHGKTESSDISSRNGIDSFDYHHYQEVGPAPEIENCCQVQTGFYLGFLFGAGSRS